MQEVTFVSSRPVAKRRGTDNIDTRPAKRLQQDDDSSSEDSSSDDSSSTDSDESSDDENGTGGIDTAMSAVQITPEPTRARLAPRTNEHVKLEGRVGEPVTERIRQIGNSAKANAKRKLARELMQKYIDELEDVVRRNTKEGNTDREVLKKGVELHTIWNKEVRSTYSIWTTSRDVLLKRIAELEGPQKSSDAAFPVAALEEIARLEARSASKKAQSLKCRQEHRLLEETSRAQEKKILGMQTEISDLKEDVREQKKLCEEAVGNAEKAERRRKRTKDRLVNKQAEMLQESESTISNLQKSQDETNLQLRQCDAEINSLKANHPDRKPDMDKSALKQAQKRAKTSEARAKKMFNHYDTLHNKNVFLIGKLTAMAQAGGFGNHGSTYRKELDALKAPSLEELDGFQE